MTPYHPLVFHLDLCILAYQLYAQSLVWPFDPYYEESNNLRWDRTALIKRVRAWAQQVGPAQVAGGGALSDFRGPGVLAGFDDNPAHDPIVYRYGQLYPWRPAISNAAGQHSLISRPATSSLPRASSRRIGRSGST